MSIENEVEEVVKTWCEGVELYVIAVFSRAGGGVDIAQFSHSSVLEAEVRYKALREAGATSRGVVVDVFRTYPEPKRKDD